MSATARHDVRMAMPTYWDSHVIDEETRASTEAEIAELLEGKVEDPAATATATWDEYMAQYGAGNEPLFIANLRHEFEDETVMTATLTAMHNELVGDLATWADVYEDSEPRTVDGRDALLTFEATTVQVGELIEQPLTMCTWRWIVAIDGHSTAIFSFTTPNHELAEPMFGHFETIMEEVRIGESAPAPTATPADDDESPGKTTEAED